MRIQPVFSPRFGLAAANAPSRRQKTERPYKYYSDKTGRWENVTGQLGRLMSRAFERVCDERKVTGFINPGSRHERLLSRLTTVAESRIPTPAPAYSG